MKTPYPKAIQNRLHGHDVSMLAPRRAFLRAAGLNFLLLQLLFLALFCYIFGTLYQQNGHTHNLKILFVDYDDNPLISSAIDSAYQELRGDAFPTLVEGSRDQYPGVEDVKEAVCKAEYWAGVWISAGAGGRLEDALSASTDATTYNRSNILTYTWNEARYPSVSDSVISSLMHLLSTARLSINYTSLLPTSTTSLSPSQLSVLLNPWNPVDQDIKPTTQGSRAIYNTLVIILILIQEFFYLGSINGLYLKTRIYARLYPHRIYIYRTVNSLLYTLIGSLCTAATIYAFRSTWSLSASQFFQNWAILWLFAHINFLILDLFTIWLTAIFLPMALITWIILNVASILEPFELVPGIYKWGWALPAHDVYLTLVDIWSSGCNPKLYISLPVLWAWWVLGMGSAAVGVWRRCHFAVLEAEAEERALRDRVDRAMAFERKMEEKRRGTVATIKGAKEEGGEVGGGDGVEEGKGENADGSARDESGDSSDREAMAEEIKEDNRLEREATRASRACNFGPAFHPAFRGGDD